LAERQMRRGPPRWDMVEGQGRIYIRGCKWTPQNLQKQWKYLKFHHICTLPTLILCTHKANAPPPIFSSFATVDGYQKGGTTRTKDEERGRRRSRERDGGVTILTSLKG
jgi:hypothetical protein